MTTKRTTDMKLLEGKIGSISMMDLRKRPGDTLLQVQLGKTFNITKHGKIIAVLSSPESTAAELGAEVRRIGLIGAYDD